MGIRPIGNSVGEARYQKRRHEEDIKRLSERLKDLDGEKSKFNTYLNILGEIYNKTSTQELKKSADRLDSICLFIKRGFKLKNGPYGVNDQKSLYPPINFGFLLEPAGFFGWNKETLEKEIKIINGFNALQIGIIEDEDCATHECPFCKNASAYVIACCHTNLSKDRSHHVHLYTICPDCFKRSDYPFAILGQHKFKKE